MLVRAVLVATCLLAATTVNAQAATCGWNGFDFSTLMGTDIQGSDGGSVYTYWLNVCGPLKSQTTCTNIEATASACQIQQNPKGQSFDTGNWPTNGIPSSAWGYIDQNNPSKGVMYSMTGAQSCWASGSPTDYYANILFTCATAQGAMTVIVPSLSCTQNFTIPTPLACGGSTPGGGGGGDSPKHGLSGGWVFIIILCVCIPVYIVVGCIYKSQRLGATGIDKCPNIELWRDLPSLVKEGCVFTYTKLRGLCGGGGGGGKDGGSYETM